jgi:hypothetical protein
MSTEINRRDFLKVIFSTASTAAMSGLLPLWPKNALSRPIAEPVILEIGSDGYLIMKDFDWGGALAELPTFREQHQLENLSPKNLKERLNAEIGLIEHIVSDPEDWSLEEVEDWLNSSVELEDLGLWEAMSYTEYGPAIDIWESVGWDRSEELGLTLIEGDHPGSDFAGVQFFGDPTELNRELQREGLNLIVE